MNPDETRQIEKESASAESNHDQNNSATKPLKKMASGGEELRDHDFAVSQRDTHGPSLGVAVDTGAPPLELEKSGGAPGKQPGDTQKSGAVGTILNQDAIDPDNFADR